MAHKGKHKLAHKKRKQTISQYEKKIKSLEAHLRYLKSQEGKRVRAKRKRQLEIVYPEDKLRQAGIEKFQKSGKYGIEIKERKKEKGKIVFKKVPLESFKRNHYYRVYIIHRDTGYKRLLSFGKLRDLPIVSKVRTRDPKQIRLLGGRHFKPLKQPKKAIGKWIPTYRIVQEFEKELERQRKEARADDVMAAILPMKRYYHTDWKIFSDNPLKGSLKVREVFVSTSVLYEYPQRTWVGKRNIRIDFKQPIMLRNLMNHEDDIIRLEALMLESDIPAASIIQPIQINGFIPVKFVESKRKGKKKHGSKGSKLSTNRGKNARGKAKD